MKSDLQKAASLVTPFFTVRQSGIQGKGAFATKKIRKGQRIIEYIGEHITDQQADARYDETKMKRHHTFLFTLNDYIVVDGAVGGNASIFINHSCAPNCEAVIEDDHIWIYALRTIHPGEELSYDYQYELDDESDEMIDFYRCLCGAETCRGTIMKLSKKTLARLKKKEAAEAKKAAKTAKSRSKTTRDTTTRRGATRNNSGLATKSRNTNRKSADVIADSHNRRTADAGRKVGVKTNALDRTKTRNSGIGVSRTSPRRARLAR